MAKYEIKKKYLIIHLCMIVVGGLLMLCRWLNVIDPSIKLMPAFLLSHITNFALGLMFLLIFGFVVLVCGGKMKVVTIAALIVTVLSIVYECFLTVLNTPDIMDAVFGVAGTAIAYVYLFMLKKNGLVSK